MVVHPVEMAAYPTEHNTAEDEEVRDCLTFLNCLLEPLTQTSTSTTADF